MRQKIKNTIYVVVGGLDLTKLQNVVFYIRQCDVFLEYKPVIINSQEMIVTVPKKDADLLRSNSVCKMQFAYTDEYGNDDASDVVENYVDILLKSEGYSNG
jgi:hypothetical protein